MCARIELVILILVYWKCDWLLVCWWLVIGAFWSRDLVQPDEGGFVDHGNRQLQMAIPVWVL